MLRALLLLQLALPPNIVSTPFPTYHKIRRESDNIVVLHYDSGPDVASTLRYLKRKRNAYHYVITKQGTIYKLIDPKYEARHAGISFFHGHFLLNRYSIGICLSGSGTTPYTDAEYTSLVWLLRQLKQRYPDIDTTKIVGHSDIALPFGRKKDPGEEFDWPRLFEMLNMRNINEYF